MADGFGRKISLNREISLSFQQQKCPISGKKKE